MEKVRKAEKDQESKAKIKINSDAAKRFVRNALWQAADPKEEESEASEAEEIDQTNK